MCLATSNVILGMSLFNWCCLSGSSRSQEGGGCRDPFQLSIILQSKGPPTGLAYRQPAELPRLWVKALAWQALAQAMLDSRYLYVPCTACMVHLGAKMVETPSKDMDVYIEVHSVS